MSEAVTRAPRGATRVAALDGLRGLVIVSVVLNHAGGVLWPHGAAYDVPVVNGLLGGGAVIVFFVVGSFIVASGLVRDRERGTFDPWRFYLRRLVRLGAQLVLLCAAVAVALQFDPVPPSGEVLANNILHVLTYTFNEYGQTDFFSVRAELGHLWYLSVQQQCYLVLPLLLAPILVRRYRWALVVALIGVCGLVYWWRQEVVDDRGWVIASSLTSTRADGLVWGVVMALLIPVAARVRGWRHLLWISGLVLVVLKLVLPELPELAYLGPWSLAFTFVAGIVVLAIWQLDEPTRVSRLLSWSPLRRLGRASLSIFLWHLPIIVIITRHTPDWRWQVRTLLALVVLVAVVVVMERYVEEPVRRLLASRPVFRLRPATAADEQAART
ncbi:MAG TPA: acyltransferase [Nocardioides sp.]|uniref:acyltransferase family protein n=1 Tax=Nocardioides sp. TaxID=35761 RepID=UPI002B696890|nr:acyltransferase [Nocardioides sp.]HTW15166.1 acyltransferase [Nocardioides sp.]